MTILSAHRTAPKITKQYRLWRRYDEGSADYYCIDADGTELLSLRPGKPPFRHIIGRFFQDCAYCPECTWPECPNRFPKPGTGWVQGQWRGHDGSVPPKMWVDGRAVPTEWVDHLGRYVPQDVESSEPTATGEDAQTMDLYRVLPSPPQPVQDGENEPVASLGAAPVPVIDSAPVPVVEPAPAIAPEVQQAAEALALQVWSSGSKHRAQFLLGKLPDLATAYLNHAIAKQWVTVNDDDQIVPGAVNPHPMTDVPDERSSRGWTRVFG